jgi:hypothetical protein
MKAKPLVKVISVADRGNRDRSNFVATDSGIAGRQLGVYWDIPMSDLEGIHVYPHDAS